MYKIIEFQKISGASNKIATAEPPRAVEPWTFLRILKVTKTQLTIVCALWNFLSNDSKKNDDIILNHFYE